MCDICNAYKVMTVETKVNKKTINVCFTCLEGNE
jgi:hypothetical protein